MRIRADELARRMTEALGEPVDLVVVRTTSTVLRRVPMPGGRLAVRLHEIFLQAPTRIHEAVVAWVHRPSRRLSSAIDQYVRDRADAVRACRRPRTLQSRGATRDLHAIFQRLNAAQFGGALRCEITFGRGGGASGRRRRSLQYGVFDPVFHLIRIHPVLDEPWIDDGFAEFIVFHEMLHAAMPAQRGADGRRVHHGDEFRTRERAFPGYDAAITWEKANLASLLRAAARVTRLAEAATADGLARRERQLELPFAEPPKRTRRPRRTAVATAAASPADESRSIA